MSNPELPAPGSSPAGEAIALTVLTRAISATSLEKGASRLLTGLSGNLSVSGGLVFFRGIRGDQVVASLGLPEEWVAEWETESPAGIEFRLGSGLVHEPTETPGLIASELKAEGVRALWTLPLGSGGKPVGALVLASKDDSPFGDGWREALVGVAEAFGSWMEAAFLREKMASIRMSGESQIDLRRPEGIAPVPAAGISDSSFESFARSQTAAAEPDARTDAPADDGPPVEAPSPVPEPAPAPPAPSLAQILGDPPDLAIVQLDAEGKVREWPESATRLLGWTEHDMKGRSLELLFSERDRVDWDALRDAEGSRAEWRAPLRTNEGELVSCGLRVLRIDDDVHLVLRDRSSVADSERSLSWSRSALSMLGGTRIVLDPAGRILELGDGWLEGDGAAVWSGKHLSELLDTDRKEILSALRTAARQGQWSGELQWKGDPITLQLRTIQDPDGNLDTIVGVRAPETSAGDCRDLFQKIPVGMILLDPEMRIVEANPEIQAVCGPEAVPPDCAGLDVRSLAIFQTRQVQTALDGLRNGNEFDLHEVVLKNSGDEELIVQFRGKPLTGQSTDGGYLLTLLNRTGKSDLERQLLRAQKMESIGSFASGLAHDFGNFVSVILGKAGVLRVKLPHDPHITGDIDDIETAAKRAQHLSQELMKFARGGRNRVAELHLNRLIEEVGSLIQTSVGKRIEVIFRLHEGVSPVEGDEVELQQLVLNLCLNARDAMTDGGRLTIETRPLTPEQIAALDGGEDLKGGVCLVVKDTGIGMPPEVSERIFEPFFSTKDDPKGTGLGLAMVYGIVRRHGGTIDVKSQEGVGTTFEIVLPAASEDREEGGNRGVTILVVDDEPAFREMIRIILEEDGHEVRLAANGIEALKTLRQDCQDLGLVILDLRMPGIDGLGVLEELQELAPDLPVLVTTGYASPEEKRQALTGGAQKVLEKPYRVNDLRGALTEILGPDAGPGPTADSLDTPGAGR